MLGVPIPPTLLARTDEVIECATSVYGPCCGCSAPLVAHGAIRQGPTGASPRGLTGRNGLRRMPISTARRQIGEVYPCRPKGSHARGVRKVTSPANAGCRRPWQSDDRSSARRKRRRLYLLPQPGREGFHPQCIGDCATHEEKARHSLSHIADDSIGLTAGGLGAKGHDSAIGPFRYGALGCDATMMLFHTSRSWRMRFARRRPNRCFSISPSSR
jgi:hypothetical protein